MIYKLRMISSEEESFFRDFEAGGEQTLLELHQAIQEELGYDSSQMTSFFTSNENWEKEREITLMDMGDEKVDLMENVKISEAIKEKKDRLLYVFDMLNERTLFLECTGKGNKVEGKDYPCCEKSAGLAPLQMEMGASDFMSEQIGKSNVFDYDDELDDIMDNYVSLDDISEDYSYCNEKDY